MSAEHAGAAAGLRLAILTPSLSRLAGGMFHSVRRPALELQRLGVEPRVFAPADRYTETDAAEWGDVPIVPLPGIGPRKLGIAPALPRALRASAPRIVHQHGLWTFSSLASLASGAPVVISPRGMLDPWALDRSRWKKRLALRLAEARNLHRAACLHALTDREARAMRDLGLSAPIAVIPNGTDLPTRGEIATAQRPGWLPADGRRTLLFLGRLHPKKGVRELLQAWSLLRRAAPHVSEGWRLVLAGWDDGNHLQELRRACTAQGLAESVLFPGPVHGAAKHALLSHADAFILPSHSEGLPMAVLEAWSHGLPVLMTRACNLSFAFEAGAAAEISTDPERLAHQLATILCASDLPGLGECARRLAADQFGWLRVAGMFDALYAWILGRLDRPDFVIPADPAAPQPWLTAGKAATWT